MSNERVVLENEISNINAEEFWIIPYFERQNIYNWLFETEKYQNYLNNSILIVLE